MIITVKAQTPNLNWAHGFQSDFGPITSAVDASGNFYVATAIGDGWGSTTIDPLGSVSTTYISGQWTYVVAKYNSNGNFIWMNDYAHPNGIGSAFNGVIINGIEINNNNELILTGKFIGTFDFDLGPGTTALTSNGDYDGFVMKLNTNGELLWIRQIGNALADNITAITVDNNNNIIVSGTYNGTLDLDPSALTNNVNSQGLQDVFILKLNDNGGMIYGKSIGGISNDAPTKLVHTSTNDIILSGWCFNSNGDFDPNAGTASLTYNGANGNFIIKLDNSGTFQFAKAFGNMSNSNIRGMEIDNNDNISVTGTFSGTMDLDPSTDTINYTSQGNQDIYIIQISAAGITNWIKTIGSVNNEEVYSLAINSNNELLLGTSFVGTVDFDPGAGVYNLTTAATIYDGAFLSINNSGSFLNAYNFNVGNGAVVIESIAIDNSNNIHSAGIFYGAVDFDFGTGTSNINSVSSNLFIAKWGGTVTGIQSNEYKNEYTIYPSPAHNSITVECKSATTISISNIIGQEILTKQIQNKETIDISNIENGIYFIKDLNSGSTIKFIKQ